MTHERPIRVMFVCAGNICRSPMAEAVFRHRVNQAGLSERFDIASSGTGSWHVGEPPHHGTQAVLRQHSVAVGNMRAQQLSRADLEQYDYVLVADQENMRDVESLRTPPAGELRYLLDFAPDSGQRNLPDPYYTGNFDYVYQLVDTATQGLLAHIREKEQI